MKLVTLCCLCCCLRFVLYVFKVLLLIYCLFAADRHGRLVEMQRIPDIKTPLQLYRHLCRRVRLLPLPVQDYYKHYIRQVPSSRTLYTVSSCYRPTSGRFTEIPRKFAKHDVRFRSAISIPNPSRYEPNNFSMLSFRSPI